MAGGEYWVVQRASRNNVRSREYGFIEVLL